MRALRPLLAPALLGAVLVAGGGLRAPDAAAAACGPAPAGSVAVVVVVDGPSGVSQRCVVVAERTRGAEVLAAAGHTLRSEAGFLCAIDGAPATGCATSDPSGPYWSYWYAAPGGAWTYSSNGAWSRRVPPRCAVEGWRFVGRDVPRSDAAPRAAVPAPVCELPPAPAPTPTPAPAPPATAPAGAAPAPGGGVPAPPAPVAPGTAAGGGSTGAPGSGAASPGSVAGATTVPGPAAGPDGSSTGSDTDDAAAAAVGDGSDSDATDGGAVGGPEVGADASAEAVVGPQSVAAAEAGRGSPVGVLVVVAVLVGLGGVALLRQRAAARSAAPDAGDAADSVGPVAPRPTARGASGADGE